MNTDKHTKRKKRKSNQKRKLYIFLFPASFIYFEILLRIFNGTDLFAHLFYPIVFSIAVGFFCTGITFAFPRRTNQRISTFLLFAFGLLFTVECLIKDSFQVYMPLKSVATGAGGVMGGFSSELISSILHGIPVIVLFFLPAILYLVFMRRNLRIYRPKLPFTIMLLVSALVFTGIGSAAALIGSSKLTYRKQYEFDHATQVFGLLTGLRLNTQYDIFGNPAANKLTLEPAKPASKEVSTSKTSGKKEKNYGKNVVDLPFDKWIQSTSDETLSSMHTYVNSLTPSDKNAYTGLFKGKNLILICAEAFSDVVIDKDMTPTLYRMAHNGFYFSDYYQPTWGGSTSSGEYSFLAGLAPLNGVNTMLDIQDNNEYYTMGNQLQRLGYFSRCYHNGEYDYYSRNQTHTNLGYEQFLGLGNGLEDLTGWWPRDKVMFDKTMDTYIDKQPFSIYYMTISGHCTYKKDDYRVKDNLDDVLNVVGDRYKDTTDYYLAYQLELEHALTTMIQKLEDAGIADDTVICMTSDHYPYGLEKTSTFGNDEDYVSDLYGYKYKNSWEQDHNSLIIWSGCLENENKDMVREISTPTYSLDILPTLSNLFGLEYDSRLLIGRDVFSKTEPLVLWNNHSWITTEGKYDSETNKFYPNKGSKADEAYVEKMKTIVSNKLTYSEQVIEKDYFEVLFGKKN